MRSMFRKNGALGSYLPQNYKFPSCPIKDLLSCWYQGDTIQRIYPLRFLKLRKHQSDLSTSTERTNYCRCARVFEALESIAIKKNIITSINELMSMPPSRLTAFYETTYNDLVTQLYEIAPLRIHDITYCTIANRMAKVDK